MSGARGRLVTAGLVLLFVVGLVVNALDLSEPADQSTAQPGESKPQVFRDYRDTVYWPIRDLVAGNNPYDVDGYLERRPGLQEFGLYLPAWLLLFLPFAVLPYDVSKFLYLGFLLALAVVFGWAVLRAAGRRPPLPVLLGTVGAVLLCAPGQSTLYLGQATFQVALGVIAAVALARRWPLVAGAGVALALLKPQVGIPLVVLLLVWRQWRPVLAGLAVAGLVSVVPLVAAVAGGGGPGAFAASVRENAEYSGDRYNDIDGPGYDRVDLPAVAAKLGGPDPSDAGQVVVVLAVGVVGGLALRRLGPLPRRGPVHPLAAVLVAAGILVATPHFSYDLLLLVWPLVALLGGERRAEAPLDDRWRLVIALLCAVPLLHVFRVESLLESVGVPFTVRTSMDGLAAAAAFALAAGLAFLGQRGGDEERSSASARSTVVPRWNSSSK